MNTENIDLLDIDPQLVGNLMPFQREGVWYNYMIYMCF